MIPQLREERAGTVFLFIGLALDLIRNAKWSGFSTAIRAVTGLLVALLAVKLLGGERYGQLVTLLSLFVLYLSLNTSIFTILVTKLIRQSMSDWKLANNDLLSAASTLSLASVILLSAFTLLLWMSAPGMLLVEAGDSEQIVEIEQAVLMMGIMATLQIVTALQSGIIEGAGRLDLAMKWQLVGPVLITIMLFSLFVFDVSISMIDYAGLLCVGAVVDTGLLWMIRRRLLILIPLPRCSRQAREHVWSLLRSGGMLQAASLMSLFLEPMNKLLLNHFIGPLAVTAYDLAMKIIWGIQSLFAAAMRVFLHLSGEESQVVNEAYGRVLALVLVPVMAAHIAAAIFLARVSHQWVTIGDIQLFMFFFGITTISNLGMIYITPLYMSLIGRGDLKFIFRCNSIVAISNLLGSLLLIPQFGILGAAVGLLIATVYNVVAIYFRHERIVGTSVVLVNVLKGRKWRYLMVLMLFIAAVVSGSGKDLHLYVEGTILVCTALLMLKEPLLITLLGRKRWKD